MATIWISKLNDKVSLGIFGFSNTVLTMFFIIIIKGVGEAMIHRIKKISKKDR